jgi:hypothetical protein
MGIEGSALADLSAQGRDGGQVPDDPVGRVDGGSEQGWTIAISHKQPATPSKGHLGRGRGMQSMRCSAYERSEQWASHTYGPGNGSSPEEHPSTLGHSTVQGLGSTTHVP